MNFILAPLSGRLMGEERTKKNRIPHNLDDHKTINWNYGTIMVKRMEELERVF